MREALAAVLREVSGELMNAQEWFGPLQSRHEAIAVIREEYLELEQAVFKKGLAGNPRSEAIQLAAMAVRMVLEVEDRKGLS